MREPNEDVEAGFDALSANEDPTTEQVEAMGKFLGSVRQSNRALAEEMGRQKMGIDPVSTLMTRLNVFADALFGPLRYEESGRPSPETSPTRIAFEIQFETQMHELLEHARGELTRQKLAVPTGPANGPGGVPNLRRV